MPHRSPTAADLNELPQLINRCFASYPETIRMTPGVLKFYKEWFWDNSDFSLVDGTNHQLHGVVMAGRRNATYVGKRLDVVHLGPIAISPHMQRRGVATRLLQAIEEKAREEGVDLLTLTTQANQKAHRLYRRLGFGLVEAYRPLVMDLEGMSAEGEAEGTEGWSPVVQMTFSRSDCISERWELPEFIPEEMKPRCYNTEVAANHAFFGLPDDPAGNGYAETAQWQVFVREGQRETLKKVTQITRLSGEPPDIKLVVEAATRQAIRDGSSAIYCVPAVATELPGFTESGSPMVYRMAKQLTDFGDTAVKEAVRYDEILPAP